MLTVKTKRREIEFSENDLQEMIDSIDDYYCADNLPKWLMVTGWSKFNKRSIKSLLNRFIKKLNNGESLYIDLSK